MGVEWGSGSSDNSTLGSWGPTTYTLKAITYVATWGLGSSWSPWVSYLISGRLNSKMEIVITNSQDCYCWALSIYLVIIIMTIINKELLLTIKTWGQSSCYIPVSESYEATTEEWIIVKKLWLGSITVQTTKPVCLINERSRGLSQFDYFLEGLPG